LDYDPGDTKVDPKNKHFYGGWMLLKYSNYNYCQGKNR
jgi:hypothetical protein